MEQYIKKSALVGEIEKRISEYENCGTENTAINAKIIALQSLLIYINTIEVKEVPEWKRATEDKLIGCLVWDEQRHFHLYNDRVFKGELYISMGDILELPNSPIKNKYDRQSTENPRRD